MEKIPTAKDYFLQKVFPKSFFESRDSVELDYEIDPSKQESVQIMIEFAKMHVEAALKEVNEKVEVKWTRNNDYSRSYDGIDENSIINSYPLDNIK